MYHIIHTYEIYYFNIIPEYFFFIFLRTVSCTKYTSCACGVRTSIIYSYIMTKIIFYERSLIIIYILLMSKRTFYIYIYTLPYDFNHYIYTFNYTLMRIYHIFHDGRLNFTLSSNINGFDVGCISLIAG